MIAASNTKAFHATLHALLRCAAPGKLSLHASAGHNPTSTPVWLPTQLPASSLIYLPLEPAGTPEANPSRVVELDLIDAVTQQPVAATVYLIPSAEYREPTPLELMLHNTERVEIKLPATLDSWFVIRAPGYADWPLRLHYRLKTSRKLSGPIQLQRWTGQGNHDPKQSDIIR